MLVGLPVVLLDGLINQNQKSRRIGNWRTDPKYKTHLQTPLPILQTIEFFNKRFGWTMLFL